MARPDKWLSDVTPRSKVRSVARSALAAQLNRVSKNLRRAAKASLKEAEDIHRLRTSSRRAAAAVELFRPLLPKKRARWFEKQLKKIRRAAGEVRDLDVMLEQAGEQGSGHSEENSELLNELAKRRKRALQPLKKLRGELEKSGKLARKQAGLLRDLKKPVAMQHAQPPRLREWAACRLAPQVRAFLALGAKRLTTVEAAHEFRIAGKELRYVLEVVGGALPAAAARVYLLLGELQQKIGVICDHAAAERMYGELLSMVHPANRSYVRTKAGSAKKRRTLAHQAFLSWWRPRRRKALRTALSGSVLLQ